MTDYTKLIEALRCDGNCKDGCPYSMDNRDWCDETRIIKDAADALEAAGERIAELEKSYSWKAYAALEESIEGYKVRIAELEAQNELKDGTITAMATDIGKLRAQMPKQGEWKWDSNTGTYHCSECNATSPREDQDGEYVDCPNYCPNCGARMKGENDEQADC
jgi:DNA-directed RNA polymerase subunit RPC12/RpoP